MEYLAARDWSHSTGINAAGRGFVERWRELFHRLTLDAFRVRHLNLRLAFEELVTVISDVDNIGTDTVNVRDVCSEIVQLLKDDPVANEVLPAYQLYFSILS